MKYLPALFLTFTALVGAQEQAKVPKDSARISIPGCTRDPRACDLDHLQPYGSDGPPGQTSPDNLACLCRRHHRAKTLGAWRYTRTPEGHYLWHGPYGARYLVTPTGTHRQP